MAVVIETTLGDFTIDLYTEERPQTCKNFLKLCKIKYYNFCLFHSVQPNFLAQTGDPTGSGTGGESIFGIVRGDDARYYEAEKLPKLKHTKPGLLSMVNCGNNLLGSQFFLTLGSELQSLDEHCIFAEITEGLEILLKLNETICDNLHRPYKDIRITHTVILEDPFEDPVNMVVPATSPEPSQLTLQNGRIGADEEIDETAGMTVVEVEEMKQAREAQARATILEIVGDLPDAEMAPPENVLFVCKLNPVTNDDDLEIIFSRFGKVKSCEVIRDHETGDSLQYAFIEFEEQRACEEAYFKMDNVLIDDRRIHVDFSQSVAKMRWKGKGRGVEYFNKGNEEKPRRPEESRNNTKRDNYKDNKDNSHRDNRDRNHKRREDDRQRRREGDYDRRLTEKRTSDDYRKSDDRKRNEGSKKWEGSSHRDSDRKRDHDSDRRNYDHRSRNEKTGKRENDRKDRDSSKHFKDDRGREKSYRDSSRSENNTNSFNESHRDKHQNSHQVRSNENGVKENKSTNSKPIVAVSKDKSKKEETVNQPSTPSSDVPFSRISDNSCKTGTEEKRKSISKHCEAESPLAESVSNKESNTVSAKKTKRKRTSSETKHKKKRKLSTSSDSSSDVSDSSNSSSSSDSGSSDYKRKHKHKTTVAKKYYHRGKLVKVVKKQKDSSESESSSDSSSDSDRKKRKHKGKKKHHTKKIVKIIEKRKRRADSSDDSDSDSSSSEESEDERSKKRKKSKTSEKRKKKKKNNVVKKNKKSKNNESSESEES